MHLTETIIRIQRILVPPLLISGAWRHARPRYLLVCSGTPQREFGQFLRSANGHHESAQGTNQPGPPSESTAFATNST
eukprot:146251-Amphidinium_carterae.2